ncbi:MAG: TMEM165/GDT1 family protein [Acidimicrobiia bacterium]|nr:TMEM165/GDT1 family protein [Acidimicrobiia bacterium]
MDSALVAFAVVFVAEIGDKSQFMTLAFAARYRPVTVLVGISAATAVMNGVSVLVGEVVGAALPTGWVAVAAGVAFLGFAAWTVRDHGHPAEEAIRWSGLPVLAVAGTFLLAEFGDKTMLATATLAGARGWAPVWLGATLGMIGANVVAIAVGRQLGGRFSERSVRTAAALAFVVFGLWLLIDGYRQIGTPG